MIWQPGIFNPYGYFGLPAPPALLCKLNLNVTFSKKGWNKEDVVVVKANQNRAEQIKAEQIKSKQIE